MLKKEILIIEDSPEVQLVVRATIGKAFTLSTATTLAEAKMKIKTKSFDLILLDVELPDGDGFGFCAELKASPITEQIPVIFLTSKAAPSDKVMGFTLGAEDYIVKPFEPLEFSARITAKFRQIQGAQEREENTIKGMFRINASQQKIAILAEQGEREMELTANEFKLLLHFIRHEDQVFTRAQLLDKIWGNETHVTDRTIDTHVYSVRKKLGPLSHFIEAVPSVGYRFTQKA